MILKKSIFNKLSLKKLSLKKISIGALLALPFAQQSHAVDCTFFLNYSDAIHTYTVGTKVKTANHGFQCLVEGWCNQGGAFAPTGWASANAWTDLGQCSGSTGDIQNYPPRINPYGPFRATGSSTIAFSGTSVAIDEDGAIASYLWTFGDGTTSTTANPQHLYANPGIYTVTLKVTDDHGATATQSSWVTINVQPNSTCPAQVYAPGSAIDKGKVIQNGGQDFRCTSSYCSSTTAEQFEPGAGSMWNITWVSLGSCAVNNDYNQYPTARITSTPGTVVDKPLQLSSANSLDADGSIVSYSWKFDGVASSTLANPIFTAATAGNHDIELTVTDNQGATDTTTIRVVASPKPNPNCWAPPYVLGTFYKEKDIVQHKNNDYQCLVQVYCSLAAPIFEPGTPSASVVWKDLGACSATKPTDPAPTCATTTPAFVQGTTYQVGSLVKQNGHKYSCKVAGWCTTGGWAFAPGAQYSDMAWTDLGVCN